MAYGVMMLGLSSYLFLTAPGNVRNRKLGTLLKAAESIPRRREAAVERIIRAQDGKEYTYKICDQRRGYLITCAGAAMEGLVSVGLGELEMPNLVKRCKICTWAATVDLSDRQAHWTEGSSESGRAFLATAISHYSRTSNGIVQNKPCSPFWEAHSRFCCLPRLTMHQSALYTGRLCTVRKH